MAGASISGGIEDLGGAVADLFGAEGSKQAGSAYTTAANIATQNEELTERSTAIQEAQQGIQISKALGTETAETAGAGFTAGGSAGDLMRASAQQAALSKQLIENQGEVTAQGYAQQAEAYTGQAQAAQTAAKGQGGGGILGAIAGVASIFGL